MCAKLCFMNKFCHKQLRETGSRSVYILYTIHVYISSHMQIIWYYLKLSEFPIIMFDSKNTK